MMLGVHIPLFGDLRLGPPFSTTVTIRTSLSMMPHFPSAQIPYPEKLLVTHQTGVGWGWG